MSAIQKITANIKDVGGIPVARLLPTAKRRSIGAWCFLDHAGPSVFAEGEAGLQVGAHPHIGLQTFTWMLAGEVLHKDSLGNEQMIRPNQVNLMTAGRGISHTEQTPCTVERYTRFSCGSPCLNRLNTLHRNFSITPICRCGRKPVWITC